MGMQVHFEVADIQFANADHDVEKEYDMEFQCHYIVVNQNMAFNTDAYFKYASFDIGQTSDSGMKKLKWLIQNRICFNAS
jgi:hypothetical protein